MNLFKHYYFIIPFIIIVFQIYISLSFNFNPTINPSSSRNSYLHQLYQTLSSANLKPLQVSLHDSQNEVEFYLKNHNDQDFKVILSTNSNPINQVTALQKLLEIANIKGRNIQFIDLSSSRPYATL